MSLLPLVSKIIEKAFKHQIQSFLDKYDIIYKFYSGFRKCFSTDSCLFYLNNEIAAGFESGFYTGMILIDLQKAFNTVNHDILLKKIEFIGFSEETTKWFKSILGPLIFLLYKNDMLQAVDCELLLYAYDTCLIFQHKDVTETGTALNKSFSMLCDWFLDRKIKYSFW